MGKEHPSEVKLIIRRSSDSRICCRTICIAGSKATWYPNSGDEIDPYAQFADVDTFMWAKVRRAALRAKVIDGVALRAEIAQIKDPGVSALFG